MRLKINCECCDARKMNEENYSGYEEISINTEEMIVDERSKAILNRLPFSIHAEEVRSEEGDARKNQPTQTSNGIFEIGSDTRAPEGTNLSVNGILKIMSGADEALKRYSRISVNGLILCPRSIAALLPLPNLSINGTTKVYPDNYTLLDNKYRLDKYFPLRAEKEKGYFAAEFIYDADTETNFNMLLEKNVKFSTDKVYLRKNHLESALPLFNIEAQIAEIPDDYKIILSDDAVLTEHFARADGKKLYVIGDLKINNESEKALDFIEGLIVDGEIKIDKKYLDKFNGLGAVCNKLSVRSGLVLSDRAMLTIGKDMLMENEEGVTVSDCALVKLDSDISSRLILYRLKISDCAKVNCTEEQRSAVTTVSSDVAMISTNKIGKIFSNIWGGIETDDSIEYDDNVRFINAEYYEL